MKEKLPYLPESTPRGWNNKKSTEAAAARHEREKAFRETGGRHQKTVERVEKKCGRFERKAVFVGQLKSWLGET
jgi:hypothetical protein